MSIVFAPLAFSLTEDASKVMHITANSTLFDYKNGFDKYEGDVNVTQGSSTLIADRVTTQKNSKHKLEEVIAYGLTNPAHYSTVPKAGDILFHSQAKIIKFYPLTSVVIFEGDVVITQGENSFHGPHIVYNIKDQLVSVPPTSKGRATIVIDPKQLQ